MDTMVDTVIPAPVVGFNKNAVTSPRTNAPKEPSESRAMSPGRMNDPVMTREVEFSSKT
jgi:hypothetical protein